MKDLLTISEAAELLHVAPCTLRRRVNRNEVPHHRIFDGMIRFSEEDIQEILRQAYRPVREKEQPLVFRRKLKWVRT